MSRDGFSGPRKPAADGQCRCGASRGGAESGDSRSLSNASCVAPARSRAWFRMRLHSPVPSRWSGPPPQHRLGDTRMREHVLSAHGAQDQIRESVDPPRLDRPAVRRRRPGRRREAALPPGCGRDFSQLFQRTPRLAWQLSVIRGNQIGPDGENPRGFADAGMNVHPEGEIAAESIGR